MWSKRGSRTDASARRCWRRARMELVPVENERPGSLALRPVATQRITVEIPGKAAIDLRHLEAEHILDEDEVFHLQVAQAARKPIDRRGKPAVLALPDAQHDLQRRGARPPARFKLGAPHTDGLRGR